MRNKPSHKQTDAEIVREKGALANDTPGGESLDSTNDRIAPKTFKGIRLHDKDKDTWGMKNTPRYEHE